jgi:hypothetical protein
MKLLVTAPWGERAGGAEMMLWLFLRHVDRSRIEPVVVFLQPGPLEREVAGLDIATVVVPSGRLREPVRATRVVGTVRSLIRRERRNRSRPGRPRRLVAARHPEWTLAGPCCNGSSRPSCWMLFPAVEPRAASLASTPPDVRRVSRH